VPLEKRVKAVLGDKTGTVTANFRSSDELKVGNYIALYKAKARIINGHI
jgi:hypothetical protein